MRELPHLVQLHQKYPDQVACITVNLDYSGGDRQPDALREPVIKLQRFDNEQGEYGDEGFNYEQHIVPLVEQLLAE